MAGARHGGAEAFFVRLAIALQRAGLDQRLLIRQHDERAGELEAAGLALRELRFRGRLDYSTPRRIRAEIRTWQPQVVLSWMSRAASMTPRGDGSFVHCARLGGYYNLKYYRHCDHLIGNTPDIVDYLVGEGWPAERAHYLPNFVYAGTQPAEPRARHYTPRNAPLLLALGRLHHNKAFDVLLDALARLPDVYLWLAGDGSQEAELKAQASRRGVAPRVRFLGWQEDTAPLYAAADAVVCPSRVEPLGNVVIEAWAQRKPVIAAAAAGPTFLIRDGETGLLVPIDDSEALADALYRVLADREVADSLGEAGHAAYAAQFTEEVVVRRYLDFFTKVAP